MAACSAFSTGLRSHVQKGRRMALSGGADPARTLHGPAGAVHRWEDHGVAHEGFVGKDACKAIHETWGLPSEEREAFRYVQVDPCAR